MKKLFYVIAMTLLPLLASGADMKFQKKAAEKVWNTRPDLFNPRRDIPDSLKEHFSAVVIGQYDYVDADYHSHDGATGPDTRSSRVCFTRKMVKLLDQKAVEDFSKHEFGKSAKISVRYRQKIAEMKETFGARIHKPDGKVTDVDMTKAFDITEGKGDKDVLKQKIDIPGLEPGDVLEYFIYSEVSMREYDLPAIRLILGDEYPVLESVVEGLFDPKLTVEFRGYNGAPDLECGVNDKKKNTVWNKILNIPALTDKLYVNRIREVPFYDFYMLNNTSPYRYYPKYMRKGGLYQNPLAGTIFRDISLVIAASNYDSSPLPGKIRKIIKNYRQEHPEATPEQLIDMAWTAANYVNITDKDGDASDFWIALMMCDILKKEKLTEEAGVAFINPSDDVPTGEIINWRQPDFGMLIGDRLYIFSEQSTFLPGELHPRYQGQLAASYPGERDKLWDFTMPTTTTTPISKASANKISHNCTVTLGEDNEATTENLITLAGGTKYLASPLTNFKEWIEIQEGYLNIDPAKRYKLKKKEDGKREEEIKEAVADIYREFYTGEEAELADIEIISRGITPEAADFKFKFTTKAPETYSMAGDEMIVKIGTFAGRQERAEEPDRHRSANISLTAAAQDNCNVTLILPEGYDVEEEALAALSSNVQNPVGMFISLAKKSPDGKSVTVATRTRYNHPLMNANAWEDMLKIIDAKSAFNDALLVLKKK